MPTCKQPQPARWPMMAGAIASLTLAGAMLSGAAQPDPQTQLLADALSPDGARAKAAIATLRQQGPNSVSQFMAAHQLSLDAPPTHLPSPPVRAALDALCQQRDCHASGLYWYTDLEQAKAAAQASGKPILSLRLLGRLDEELSCANSRFFRVVLYPNRAVSQALRDRFILHWQSERPVPKVTIDFGDGRSLERTLTGNSIHYILAADGTPIDALPGLSGPTAFLAALQPAEQAAKRYQQTASGARRGLIQQYHRDRLASLQTEWNRDLAKLGQPATPLPLPLAATATPTALEAGRLAISKSRVETPILTAIAPRPEAAPASDSPARWEPLAQLHQPTLRLDSRSQALIRSKNPALASTWPAVVQRLERSLAFDTVRNHYSLHAQLHQWFITNPDNATTSLNALNQRVYSQLFLTPQSDPWLGLATEDYTAIESVGKP
jgi:hypothetical protein